MPKGDFDVKMVTLMMFNDKSNVEVNYHFLVTLALEVARSEGIMTTFCYLIGVKMIFAMWCNDTLAFTSRK